MKKIALALLAVLAVAACNKPQPAEPGKNIPECHNGDACDYTKGT